MVCDQVGLDLAQADLAVLVEVVQEELNVGRDTALDARFDQAEVKRGADGNLGVKSGLRDQLARCRVQRVDEESVEKLDGVVRLQEFHQTQ